MNINTGRNKRDTSDKATGHHGSYIEKKSETVIFKDTTNTENKIKNSEIEVTQRYSRGAPFDTFYFKLNDETLPYEVKNDELWT